MELFSFQFSGRQFAVVLDLPLQLERLLVDGLVLSVQPLGELAGQHRFTDDQLGDGNLSFVIDAQTKRASYQLRVNDALVEQGERALGSEAQELLQPLSVVTSELPEPPKEKSWLALGGIALKLLKTVKVVKVALAAASVAVYSMIFTLEFAVALVSVLVFHEFGHLQAMKKFGIPTKGMYLIPFFGGIAVGDKPRTQWENLYISMMGPVYGLVMTAIFFVIYWVTGSHFCGLVASVSALLNLFNLIPVMPLDGGHVVKSLVFSRRNQFALIAFLTLSAMCLVVAWHYGYAFLSFFIVLGAVDLIAAWSVPLKEDITPLKTYGIWFSLAWYLLVALAFLFTIILLAKAGVPGSEIAVKILKS